MNVDLFNLPVPNIGRIAADGLVHARDLAGYHFCRFFTPMQIAARIMIPRDERFDFLRWFRIVEDVLRRIVFIEASAIATSLPPPAPSRPSRAGAGRKPPPDFDCDRLESWRPSFRMAPSQARPGSKARLPKRPRRDALPSRPLALRMQASCKPCMTRTPISSAAPAICAGAACPGSATSRFSPRPSTAVQASHCKACQPNARRAFRTAPDRPASPDPNPAATCGIAPPRPSHEPQCFT